VGGVSRVEQAWSDVRNAARSLARSPLYATTAILTLGLGIGAATAAYSVVSHVLLDPLPYDKSEDLVAVFSETPHFGSVLPSYPDFVDYRELSDAFAGMAYATGGQIALRRSDGAIELLAADVTSDFFKVLRVRPLLGRVLADQDTVAGAPRAAVLSYGTWVRQFGSDKGVIGRIFDADIGSFTVVGVLDRGQAFPDWVPGTGCDLFLPLNTMPTLRPFLQRRGTHVDSRTIARLKPGVRRGDAEARLSAIAARIGDAYPTTDSGFKASLVPLRRLVVGDVTPALALLGGSTLLVFLLAVSDVANLSLVRASGKVREFAVRAAIGADRSRLMAYALAESGLLAVFGTALGLVFAEIGVKLIVSAATEDIPRIEEVSLGAGGGAIGAGLMLISILICGLSFTVALRGESALPTLKTAATAGSQGRAAARIRSSLVVGQLALALVLVSCAGLLIKSFIKLRSANLGFDPSHLVVWHIGGRDGRYATNEERWRLFKQEVEAVRAVPGVVAVSLVNHMPPAELLLSRVGVDGTDPTTDSIGVGYKTIGPGFFETTRAHLLQGREFTDADMTPDASVAIVSTAMAKRYWPGGDNPIGHELTIMNGAPHDKEFGKPIKVRVVGIAGSVRATLDDDHPDPVVYMPYTRPVWGGADLVARTVGRPAAAIPAIRQAVTAVDPDITVDNMATEASHVDQSTDRPRFTMTILTSFSVVALILAVLGLYGVVSYSVALRRAEVGIRMALGASSGRITRLIIFDALRLLLIGGAIGGIGAVGLANSIRSVLYGVRPLDMSVLASVAVTLAAVTVIASYIPARRAARVDPLVALRSE